MEEVEVYLDRIWSALNYQNNRLFELDQHGRNLCINCKRQGHENIICKVCLCTISKENYEPRESWMG